MIRLGILGAGFMGAIHARAWQRVEEARVMAVAAPSIEKARRLGEYWGADAVESADEVVTRTDLDAVDICLPTHLHEKYAVSALLSGKHVLCEKPLALSVESAARILEVASRSGKRLMVGQVVRFWPQYSAARQIVMSGRLGELRAIHASRTSRPPDWADWFRDPNQSGGALFDLHIHDLDYVVSLLGKPQSVHGQGVKSGFGAWDYVSTHLDYGPGKAKVHLEASCCMPGSYPFSTELRMFCDRGLLEYSFRVAGNVESRDEVESRLTLWSNGGVSCPPVPGADGYYAEICHFAECVRTNLPSEKVPNSEVRLVLQIVEAIKRSLEGGEVISL